MTEAYDSVPAPHGAEERTPGGFVVLGLSPEPFAPLFKMTAEELASRDIDTHIADDDVPCRISLSAPAAGTRVLLINYHHLDAKSPYASAGPIFISEEAGSQGRYLNFLPPVLASRLLSTRAYDEADRMLDAQVCEGSAAAPIISAMLDVPDVHYLHLHFAKRGCFAARVIRTEATPS
ncbi:DUF1203 domain-containing protein [Paucibacter sp. O1-1]|nr:DUF1203 domain-containing protein [Paucibacter sp. O1-1]MDA3828784.1 DUF1203 domain-containing protein [Paucibacter sp. O1-1]